MDIQNNMKHMYLRLHCSFTLDYWILKQKKTNLVLTFTKMCVIGQMNECSNHFIIWANKRFDCQHPSPPSCSVHITEQYSAKRSEKIFSFIGSLSEADKLHHHSGTRFTCTGCVCSPSQAHPAGMTPSGSSKPRRPLTPASRLQQSEWSCAGLEGVVNEVNVYGQRAACSFYVMLPATNAIRANILHYSASGCLYFQGSLSSVCDVSFRKSLGRRRDDMNVVQVNVVAQCVFESEWSDCSQ